MPEASAHSDQALTVRRGQPLIGIPAGDDVDEVVRYFTSEEDADVTLSDATAGIRRALSLIGAWQHLDAEDGPDMLDELDRIRHESTPTPPFEL